MVGEGTVVFDTTRAKCSVVIGTGNIRLVQLTVEVLDDKMIKFVTSHVMKVF